MTWRDVLSAAACRSPDKEAFEYWPDGAGSPLVMTYAELDRAARLVAAHLVDRGLSGKPAVLLYPPGLAYVTAFFGCLYAGVLAVPAYPPTARPRSLTRLFGIVADCGATAALTTKSIAEKFRPQLATVPQLAGLDLVPTDNLADSPDHWDPPPLTAASLAFLQYTSGSTAAPRGVMLTHGNLLANAELIKRLFGLSAETRAVSWLPMYHDMGLIGSVMGSIYCGGSSLLMSPTSFGRDPIRWLRAISTYGCTASGGPNFAYDLCVERATEESTAELDLSTWEVAFNGAEPVRSETMARFADRFAPHGFRSSALLPCYGLAEASLIVTAGPRGAGYRVSSAESVDGQDGSTVVGSGAVPAEQQLLIVDPHSGRPCPDRSVGEIWLAGRSVASGYWNSPERSAETFGARLAEPADTTAEFLRTGDLGFLSDGELFVTGRHKDLIIVRGRNHYPQDIEYTVQDCDPALQPNGGAAFGVSIDGAERLVVVHELRRHHETTNLTALCEHIRVAVADRHEIRPAAVVLIAASTLPRTSSGKVSRHQVRAAYQSGELSVVVTTADSHPTPPEPASEPAPIAVLDTLREQVCGLLNVAPDQVPTGRLLPEFGLDSLGIVTLQHRIQQSFGVDVELDDMYGLTLEALAVAIVSSPRRHEPIPSTDECGDFPLSSAQQAMWFLQQLAPERNAYVVGVAASASGPLDVAAFEAAVGGLVARHAALRTTFPLVDGGPVQRVHQNLAPAFDVQDATDWDDDAVRAQLEQALAEPMDLCVGPLLRLTLLRRSPDEHHLVLAVHHMVTDLWSMGVLASELDVRYRSACDNTAPALPHPPPSYVSFAARQRDALANGAGELLWEFWRDELAGAPTMLDVPTDRARPAKQQFRGDAEMFTVDAGTTRRLDELARSAGTTVYTLVLAAFQVLLSRYAAQSDVIVGTPSHGRHHADLANAIGSFVNTVPVRSQIDPAESFSTLLRRTHNKTRDALKHAGLPFGDIVDRLQVRRDPGRSPLVQALLSFDQPVGDQGAALTGFGLGHPAARIALGELELSPIVLPQHSSQFDLAVTMSPIGDELAGRLIYDTCLFDQATAVRLVGHFTTLLAAFAADPEHAIGDAPLISAGEASAVIEAGAGPVRAHNYADMVPDLVAARAAETPDALAVVFDDVSHPLTTNGQVESGDESALSYAALDQAANRLARHLITLGVGPECIVGLLLPRSAEMVVAMLGVLRAGGAYLPIDTALPDDRIEFMLADSGTSVVVTESDLASMVTADDVRLVPLDQIGELLAALPGTAPVVAQHPDNLAYVLYTSGSTGRPKGVQIPHRALSNLLASMADLYEPAPGDRLLAITTFSFDISGLEVFLPLTSGGILHVLGRRIAADGDQLRLRLDSGKYRIMQATPVTWELVLEAGWRGGNGLVMLCGGEALPPHLAKQLAATGAPLWNMFGPTETTIWSTVAAIGPEEPGTPIGRSIANTRCYVLDDHLNPVPAGLPGELYIGGDGVARGYLRRPSLTAERFVADPYGEPGARMYRTGDLARFRPDGQLDCLGRIDNQVKVNGLRIELGEIEAALDREPTVRKAVVDVYRDGATPILVGYLQSTYAGGAAGFDRQAAEQTLRERLQAALPSYFVPTSFEWLDELPLTPNGKVDRRALPPPTLGAGRLEPVAPATATEAALLPITAELLHAPRMGCSDNLFHLGAHSLLMSRLALRIREKFGVGVPLHKLFDDPTVQRIAALIDVTEHEAVSSIPAIDRSRYAASRATEGALRIPELMRHRRRNQRPEQQGQ